MAMPSIQCIADMTACGGVSRSQVVRGRLTPRFRTIQACPKDVETIHLGSGRENFLLLPIIPDKPKAKPPTKPGKPGARRATSAASAKSKRHR
jgi:hypothetical protein